VPGHNFSLKINPLQIALSDNLTLNKKQKTKNKKNPKFTTCKSPFNFSPKESPQESFGPSDNHLQPFNPLFCERSEAASSFNPETLQLINPPTSLTFRKTPFQHAANKNIHK
jgi:hypothetical protein